MQLYGGVGCLEYIMEEILLDNITQGLGCGGCFGHGQVICVVSELRVAGQFYDI